MYGFVYSNGQYTRIDPLGSSGTFASSINNSGQVVGWYDDNPYTTNYGFVATDPPSPINAGADAVLQLVHAMASFAPTDSALTASPFNQTTSDVMQLSLAQPH